MQIGRDSISPPASSRSSGGTTRRRSLRSSLGSLLMVRCRQESHTLLSPIFLTIRPFPRFVRVSLLFASIYLLLAVSAVFVSREVEAFTWNYSSGLLAAVISNITIGVVSCVNHVNRRPLEKAKTTSEFISKSYPSHSKSIERGLKIRWCITVCVTLGITSFCAVYFSLYCHVMSIPTVHTALGAAVVGLVVDWGVLQPGYALALLCLKKIGQRQVLKAGYRCVDRMRMWKSTDPEGD